MPEGYFNKLPHTIQGRISDHKKKSAILFIPVPVLRYTAPAFALVITAIVWFSGPTKTGPESLLADVETEHLMAYLNASEFSTDDLLDGIDLNDDDLNAIEKEVYGLAIRDESIEDILDNMDLN